MELADPGEEDTNIADPSEKDVDLADPDGKIAVKFLPFL